MRFFLTFTALLCLISFPAKANEGAGLLHSDLNGALPKALWRGQPRSEINFLLKQLPPDASLRSIQEIKRNMLLSNYDTSLINNDIEVPEGEDFLTLRLEKLTEMGLWEDAFSLYTKTTEDPGENNKLAQVGVTLILLKKGLSTACLEEKVIAPRFPNTEFWTLMDNVCDTELGTNEVLSTQLAASPVIQAIYNESNFKIAANSLEALNKLSPLELALVSAKGRIDYQGIDLKRNTPPRIIKTFLNDPKFPQDKKDSLEKIAIQQGLLSESPLSDEEKNQLTGEEKLAEDVLIKLISKQLRLGQKIPAEAVQKLTDLAAENPQNFFYLQILDTLKATESDIAVSKEDLERAETALSTQNSEKVNLLKSLLDKPGEFSNNRDNIYEKQISLTPEGHYVMPTDGFANWLEKTKTHQFAGLSLLIILSNIEVDAKAENS
ncbi:MAG TPA: hypothetical protein PLF01_07570, partial [Alphaproteobacteria bacterium]|nr:hypothetical protein [Alphaproteobacteria bacterium]